MNLNLTNEEITSLQCQKRPGKEIKLTKSLTENNNISCKIGTIDDKNHPKTIYIYVSFWIDIKNKDYDDEMFSKIITQKLKRELVKIYNYDLKDILKNNEFFPHFEKNIYTYDFPHNLNYNNKKSFACIELNLHTINCLQQKKESLKNNSQSKLFSEALKIYKIIEKSNLLNNKTGDFKITKSKK